MQDHVDKLLIQWQEHRPDLDCSPMGIIGRMYRAQRIMTDSINVVFKSYGLSQVEFDILASLRRAGEPLTPTQLYHTVMLSSGAMTARLDKLTDRGLIYRQPSDDDRRSCKVWLTDEGQALVDKAVTAHVANEHQMLTALDKDEQAQLAGLLRKWLLANESALK
ncbi:MarR family winged helix-turn-helix transcriptional regulator [Photobacterium sp. TLY01]|uniref:MarR family winged helix-turn-helix transcriptional regulator n=1 Tax=Photobacterium sp. TLY01 TaxID=2907534 RepID=UPI001F4698FB|nr:MarR family transcriptional regulator [Photobacterium sp. TLY01]UIP29706.1 MarR family transcriptional regulator [Photobacterium sp. TLY01]